MVLWLAPIYSITPPSYWSVFLLAHIFCVSYCETGNATAYLDENFQNIDTDPLKRSPTWAVTSDLTYHIVIEQRAGEGSIHFMHTVLSKSEQQRLKNKNLDLLPPRLRIATQRCQANMDTHVLPISPTPLQVGSTSGYPHRTLPPTTPSFPVAPIVPL